MSPGRLQRATRRAAETRYLATERTSSNLCTKDNIVMSLCIEIVNIHRHIRCKLYTCILYVYIVVLLGWLAVHLMCGQKWLSMFHTMKPNT